MPGEIISAVGHFSVSFDLVFLAGLQFYPDSVAFIAVLLGMTDIAGFNALICFHPVTFCKEGCVVEEFIVHIIGPGLVAIGTHRHLVFENLRVLKREGVFLFQGCTGKKRQQGNRDAQSGKNPAGHIESPDGSTGIDHQSLPNL
jgi:hypothetical protein